MRMQLHLPPEPADATSAHQSSASALLLGLSLLHLCQRLQEPPTELLALLQHEVQSIDPSSPVRAAAMRQLQVLEQLLAPGDGAARSEGR